MTRPAPRGRRDTRRRFGRLGVIVLVLIPVGAAGQPVSLSDSALGEVVAGYYAPASVRGGGMVVANSATADRNRAAALVLGGSAQRLSRALTLVNSAQSAIANASNVLEAGGVQEGANPAGVGQMWQINLVDQQARNAADSGDPRLLDNNSTRHQSQSSSSEFSGGILATEFEFFGSLVTTRTTTDSDGNSSTSTGSEPRSESLRIGRGIATAGTVAVASGPGRIAFDDRIELDSSATVTGSFQWSGLFFDFTVETETTVVAHTEGGVSGEVVLAPFSLQGEGVICTAQIGSCKPFVGRHAASSEVEEKTLVPADLRHAGAGRVVASGADLNEDSGGVVALNGLAQQDVGAVHLVNAAASGLANGLNVSRGSSARRPAGLVGLRQDNRIRQRQ